MRAQDVMTADVICVTPDSTVQAVAKLFLERHISAAPVIDARGCLIGIVSEGDLLRRVELGTERRRSWLREFISSNHTLASEYVKAHARHVRDIMTVNVATVSETTPLVEIADLLERRRIKRVPVVRNGKPVGIVSRANLVQALATFDSDAERRTTGNDQTIRAQLLAELKSRRWGDTNPGNIVVLDGVVHLWGYPFSDAHRQAFRVAAEGIPGVEAVVDHMLDFPILPVG